MRVRLALGAILLVTFAVDVAGLDWGLPYAWHPDEKVTTATEMIARGSANPDYFVNPSLHIYLVWGVVELAYAAHPGDKVPPALPQLIPLTYPDAPNRALTFLAYRLARLLSVGFAMLTVWLVWRRGRAAFDVPSGLLAAAFCAATMGLANLAHFATPETTVFFVTLAALASFEALARDAAPRRYMAAGALLGLACSTKYTVALLAVPFVTAHIVASRRERRLARSMALLAVAIVCGAAAFVIATPYSVLSHRRFLEDLAFNWTTGAPGGSLADQRRSYAAYVLTLANALGWPLFVVAVAAAAYAVGRVRSLDMRGRAAIVVHGVWIAAFFAFLGLSPHHALRFIMPIVPSLMILAGGGVLLLARDAPRWRTPLAAAVAATLIYSIAYLGEMDREFLNDPRYAAGQWLARHVPPGESVGYFAIESYEPFFDRPTFTVQYLPEMAQYHITGERFRRWEERLFESGPDLLVDANFYYERFRDVPRFAERADFYARLFAGRDEPYHLVARFAVHRPRWLNPAPELVAPEIVVFARN